MHISMNSTLFAILFRGYNADIIRGRGGEGSRVRQKSCSLALAIQNFAIYKRSKFQTRSEFSCENLAFLFLNKKARLEIASGPNGTPYLSVLSIITHTSFIFVEEFGMCKLRTGMIGTHAYSHLVNQLPVSFLKYIFR